jgi:ABC-type sugar transport system substrate-binding protein
MTMSIVRGARPVRRLVPLVLVAVALVAAGCGSSKSSKSTSSSSSGSTSTASSSAKKVKLGFVYATTAGNFAQEMALGAQAAAQHTPGVQFSQAAPAAPDGPAQVQLFLSALRTAKDGVGLETLFPNLFVRPFQQATQAGVPVVAVDAGPPPGTKVTFFVGNSNTELGVALAKALLPKIPKNATGQILVGTDTPGLPVLELRNKGFESAMKQARPSVTFLDFDSKQAPTDNFNTWSSQVKAHPSALAYVGPGSQDAVSMAQISRKTGKHYLVGADDLDPTALQGVKDGFVNTLISPEHWLKGYIALKYLAAHAQQGKALPNGWFNPGFLVVNKKNIAAILKRQATPASRYAYFQAKANAEIANQAKYMKPLDKAN